MPSVVKVSARILAYRISNGALAAQDLPRRLKVLDWGVSPSVKGPVQVSPLTATELPSMHRTAGWDRIALDYEHNTLKGSPEYERSQEPRAVAAYGVVVCVPGDGLYLDDLQWTPHGDKFAREYVDLSPAVVQTADGTVTAVHSVALCRHGAVDGLHFYSVDLPDGPAQAKGDGKMERFTKWLRGFLGKGEDVGEEGLLQAFGDRIKALCAEAVAPVVERVSGLETRVKALTAPAAVAEVQALSADVTALKDQVKALTAAGLARDRDAVLEQSAREGKVVALSAEAIAALSLDQLRDHVSKLPVTVPIERRTPFKVVAHATDAIPEAVSRVARAFGLDGKTVMEANKAKTLAAVAMAILLGAGYVRATALTDNRSTPERTGELVSMNVASGSVIYAGALVCENGSQYAVPASDSAGYVVIGKAMQKVDNSGVNYKAAGNPVEVRRGVFRWVNGDTFTDANVGDLAYVKDDQTVQTAASATHDIVAGVIIDVDSDGVWVDTYAIGGQGAASLASLNVSGAANLGGALSTTGNVTVGASKFTVTAASGNTTVAGTLGVTGASTLTGAVAASTNVTVSGNLIVAGTQHVAGAISAGGAAVFGSTATAAGAVRWPVVSTVVESGTARTITSADYGKLIIVTNGAAVALTLPANGAAVGSWLDVAVGAMTGHGGDDCAPTISAATQDTLIGPNDVDLDSVTWGSGHRIGAYARFWSDGSFWHVQNLGGTTMTYTD